MYEGGRGGEGQTCCATLYGMALFGTFQSRPIPDKSALSCYRYHFRQHKTSKWLATMPMSPLRMRACGWWMWQMIVSM